MIIKKGKQLEIAAYSDKWSGNGGKAEEAAPIASSIVNRLSAVTK